MLLVINYLNLHAVGAGEGEAVAVAVSPVPTSLRLTVDMVANPAVPSAFRVAAGLPGAASVVELCSTPDRPQFVDVPIPAPSEQSADSSRSPAWDAALPSELDAKLPELESVLTDIVPAMFQGWHRKRQTV